MKRTYLLDRPSGIPIVAVKRQGFAATPNSGSALSLPGLEPCGREFCHFRGYLAPKLRGGYEGMLAASRVAHLKREAGEREPFGYLFHVGLDARIAMPAARIARAMARGTAPELWDLLRPLAGENEFHGIELPQGLVIFESARVEGYYEERRMATVPAFEFNEGSDEHVQG